MVFGMAHLISYVSRFMSLQTGDIITTGTPPGVGMGQKPPIYLKPGDVMTLGITGPGEQRQPVVADLCYPPPTRSCRVHTTFGTTPPPAPPPNSSTPAPRRGPRARSD